MKYLLYTFIIALFICSCDDKNETVEPSLTLGENTLSINEEGGSKLIDIFSNGEWNIKNDIPEWCTVDKLAGEGDAKINITIEPNTTSLERKCTLEIKQESIIRYLVIIQEKGNKIASLTWHPFPVNSFSDIKIEEKGNTTLYSFTASSLFINPEVSDEIFPGNVISGTLDGVNKLRNIPEIKLEPATISSWTGGKLYILEDIEPSKEVFDNFVKDIIQEFPKQNVSFYFDNTPINFYSYKQLYLLGMSNLGIPLNEIISEAPYKEKEMEKKEGLIYSYSQTLFEVILDIEPLSESELSSEVIEEYDLSGITNISYGMTSFLIVETNDDSEKVNKIINKKIREEVLSKEEKDIIGNAVIHFLYFDKENKIKKETSDSQSIDNFLSYLKTQKAENIHPLNFRIDSYKDKSVKHLKFDLEIQ